MNLDEHFLSVTRAQEQRIFNGYIFALLSQNVSPSQTILSEVIRCGGGKLLQSLPSVKALKMVKKLRDEDPRSCKPGNLELQELEYNAYFAKKCKIFT